MNNRNRNQLIGIITLILLVLLLSPYVLVDKSKQIEATIAILPSNHEVESVLVEGNNDDNIKTPSLNEANTMTYTSPSICNDTASEQTGSNLAQTEKSYVIQLAALHNKQKIEELVALLRLSNYDVYTIPAVAKEGQLTWLFVGQYPTKAQADMVAIDLKNLSKLRGFVTRKESIIATCRTYFNLI